MEMNSIISSVFILQAIINGVNLVIAQTPMMERHLCRGDDFKSNIIQKNRDSAINNIMNSFKNSSYHGFYHSRAGDKPEEQVSAIALCNPNVLAGLCKCCIENLVPYLLKKCPKRKEGVAWDGYAYVICMVRYTTGRKILSVLDDWAWYYWGDQDRVKAVELEKTLDGLANKLKEKAAGGDALRKYASGSVTYEGNEHELFVSVQCTPDLSKENCIKCLSKAINTEIRRCCTSKPLFSADVMSTNCYVWYSHVNILDPPPKFDPKYCG